MLMVDDLYERFDLAAVIGRHKDKGISLDALVRGMLAYKLGDNFSVLQAGEWLNRPEVLDHYELRSFNVKTLYRAVETLEARCQLSKSSENQSVKCQSQDKR
jgi:transposase